MRRFLVGAATLLLLGVGHAASAAAAGPQPVQVPVTVHGATAPDAAQADTHITLKAGLPMTVSASGTVGYCGAATTDPSCAAGPNGGSFTNYDFMVPWAPAGALIGKIGTGNWFVIGAGPTTVQGSGDLYLAINDVNAAFHPGTTSADWYGDNYGSFSVTVSFTCYPGNGNGDANHYHCGAPGQN